MKQPKPFGKAERIGGVSPSSLLLRTTFFVLIAVFLTSAIENELTTSNGITNSQLLADPHGDVEPSEDPPALAETINGQSIHDSYIQNYLRQRNFFNNTEFSAIDSDVSTTMRSGNGVPEDIRGYMINGKKYGIHLIICDEESKACYFRINGIPTGKFVAQDSTSMDGTRLFSLDEEFAIKISSIQFNDCGNRRFCDIYWDTQDVVNISVVRR